MHFYQKKFFSTLTAMLFLWSLFGQSAHRNLRQGEVAFDKGNFDGAQTAYEKAGNTIGSFNAGNAALQQGNFASAANYFRDAAEKATSLDLKTDALYNLGNALLLQKKYEEAIQAYEGSLRISPNRVDAKKNLQIAKRPPTPQPPPPPPPPPPSPKPQRYYVDQALQTQKKEVPPPPYLPEKARQMLAQAVLQEEQKNAKAYRELSPSNQPSRLKKDW